METIVIHNVTVEGLEQYRKLAKTLGGSIHSIAKEEDGEFTVVIVVPEN
jgi:hypothetical protein